MSEGIVMKKVKRDELLDLGAYEQIRERFRAAVIEEKKNRRFQVSDELSIVFENHTTVLFQIQEMLRTERITRESAIQHEIDTYNELVPEPNELSATLFVEIADHDTRERRLVELAGLEGGFALDVGGMSFPGRNETRGVLPDRTTAVHYLKFPLDAAGATAVLAASRDAGKPDAPALRFRVRHPHLDVTTALPAGVVRAVAEDLLDDD
jgi:hypothetical protein